MPVQQLFIKRDCKLLFFIIYIINVLSFQILIKSSTKNIILVRTFLFTLSGEFHRNVVPLISKVSKDRKKRKLDKTPHVHTFAISPIGYGVLTNKIFWGYPQNCPSCSKKNSQTWNSISQFLRYWALVSFANTIK